MFRAILSFASVVAIDIFFRPVEGTIIYSMFRIRNQTRTDMGIRSPSVNHPNDLAAASCSFIRWSRRVRYKSKSAGWGRIHQYRTRRREKTRRKQRRHIFLGVGVCRDVCARTMQHGSVFRVQVDPERARSFDIQLIRDWNLDSSECPSLALKRVAVGAAPRVREVNTVQTNICVNRCIARVSWPSGNERRRIFFVMENLFKSHLEEK